MGRTFHYLHKIYLTIAPPSRTSGQMISLFAYIFSYHKANKTNSWKDIQLILLDISYHEGHKKAIWVETDIKMPIDLKKHLPRQKRGR